MKLVLKPVFKKEGEKQFIETLIHNQIALVQHLMWTFRENTKLSKLMTGVTDGNWNYIMSHQWSKVYILAHQLGAKSVIDLGSGAGFGMMICQAVGRTLGHREIQWNGIERYQELADIALKSQIYTTVKDIYDVTKKDIEKYDCVHMYEPAAEQDTAKRMVDHIVSILSPHQTVLMVSTGNMAHYFKKHELIESYHDDVAYQPVNIYKLAGEQTRRKSKTVARSRQTSG